MHTSNFKKHIRPSKLLLNCILAGFTCICCMCNTRTPIKAEFTPQERALLAYQTDTSQLFVRYLATQQPADTHRVEAAAPLAEDGNSPTCAPHTDGASLRSNLAAPALAQARQWPTVMVYKHAQQTQGVELVFQYYRQRYTYKTPTHQKLDLEGYQYQNVYEIRTFFTEPTDIRLMYYTPAEGFVRFEFNNGEIWQLMH